MRVAMLHSLAHDALDTYPLRCYHSAALLVCMPFHCFALLGTCERRQRGAMQLAAWCCRGKQLSSSGWISAPPVRCAELLPCAPFTARRNHIEGCMGDAMSEERERRTELAEVRECGVWESYMCNM